MFVAACGGGDDALSESEFREQANAICTEYNDKIAAFDSPSSPEGIPDYVEQVIPVIEAGIAELRDVNPPAELADDYDAMLDETDKAIPAAQELSDAAAAGDPEALQDAIAQGKRADSASDRLAAALGLDSCASDE